MSVYLSFQGLWMPTKRIADKSAALEAIKELHKVGELNKRLLPISKAMDLSDDEGDESATLERRRKHEGTTKKANYYPNKVLCLNLKLAKVECVCTCIYIHSDCPCVKRVSTGKLCQPSPHNHDT